MYIDIDIYAYMHVHVHIYIYTFIYIYIYIYLWLIARHHLGSTVLAEGSVRNIYAIHVDVSICMCVQNVHTKKEYNIHIKNFHLKVANM